MKIAAAIVVAIVLGITQTTAFEMDASKHDIRKAKDIYTVGDLTTGEVGKVTYPGFCTIGAQLYQRADDELRTDGVDDYSVIYRVRREPGNVLSIEVTVGSKVSDTTWREDVLGRLAGAWDCSLFQNLAGSEVIAVVSINGHTGAASIIGAKE